MKFFIDRCAGRKLADWLRESGHDVAESSQQGADPGDEVILASAHSQGRILVTIDTDFGALLYVKQTPHSGLVRLPDVPAKRRIELMELVLKHHADDLEMGAVITVRGGRIRVSRINPKPR